jgi:predicted nuclease with RNAse H fold
MKINEGTTPKEIISDKESRLLPNSAQLFFLLARKPSKLSKKIHKKTILAAIEIFPRSIKYNAIIPKVPFTIEKISGKETKSIMPF